MAKTVVGLMNTREEAHRVVNDLVNMGFNRDSISLMARDEAHGEGRTTTGTTTGKERTESGDVARGAGTGAAIGGGAGLLVGLAAFAIPGIGPVIAAGPLATALAGLGVGAAAGGIIGALANVGVPERDAEYYAEGVRRGGTLVTVSAEDRDADRAAEVMRRHGAADIDERVEHWRSSGWSRFDEKADPMTEEEIARERERTYTYSDRRRR
jgi:hypothetical protein